MKNSLLFLTLLLISISFSATKSYSQWNPDTSVRNPVTVSYFSSTPMICRDGERGYYIAWLNNYNNPYGKLQRVDSAGYLMWPVNGVSLSAPSSYYINDIVSDDSGGVYVIGNYTTAGAKGFIDVQRIDENGNSAWASSIILYGNISSQYITEARCIQDGHGGLIVVWGWRDVAYTIRKVFAQRIDRSGNKLWGANPVTIANIGGINNIISDGSSGVIISYWGQSSIPYVEHRDSASNQVWSVAGIQGKIMRSDGMGGSIYAFDSLISSNCYDIYFHRLDSAGNIITPQNGTLLFPCVSQETQIDLLPDYQGNFFFSSPVNRQGLIYIVSAKINSNGTALWTDTCCMDSIGKMYLKITSDNLGGFISVWLENYNNETYSSQRYTATGNQVWPEWGYPVTSVPNLDVNSIGDHASFDICTGSNGSAIVVWEDSRSGTVNHVNIYMAKVDGNTMTGISRINQPAQSVYPNPATNNLKISFNRKIRKGSVEIISPVGSLMSRTEIENESEKVLDLSKLTPGLYNVCTYDGETQNCTRVIVQYR